MGRKLIPIELTASEESTLRSMLQKGSHNSREYKRAQILLKLQAGEQPTAISEEVYCSPATVKAVKKRYLIGGLEGALKDAPRSGAPAKVTEYHEADITAIACTTAPKGRGKWTAELLSDELVKLGYEAGHSPSTVRRILKKVNLSLGKKESGV
jgi:transposase